MGSSERTLTSIEICAGAGGQAIGLHSAGFKHLALVEIDGNAAQTLRHNVEHRDKWEWERKFCDVIEGDMKEFKPLSHLKKAVGFLGRPLRPRDLDLLAGGVPCPPFSHAGKQLGKDDERDLFPWMLRLVDELRPRAVMIENVRGIRDAKFEEYRTYVEACLQGGHAKRPEDGTDVYLDGFGYTVCKWEVLEASDFGVPQLRPRAILVAIRTDVLGDLELEWPEPTHEAPRSVFEALKASMELRYAPFLEMGGSVAADAKRCLDQWVDNASRAMSERKDRGIAPTLVGGSKKHGGADLGPSRAKAVWRQLGVSGMGVANDHAESMKKKTYDRDLFRPEGPMLTVRQAAIIQGFPDDWEFDGRKTAQYRQVGNAFPPPVAHAVGAAIAKLLRAADARDEARAEEAAPKEQLPEQKAAALLDRRDDHLSAVL
ncbi:DNA (cytosine-5-)-methyltransferase [Streptomyces sp. NPDC006660]|uniref:DNA cytosine methyltransferase n=1 Tax=unclassified Streptomyces TaxID=2593676 RepID=UPI0033E6D2CB